MTVTCQYKNHQMPLNTCYIYRDIPNGIDEDIRICPDCFREHILEYYPNGILAEHLRNTCPNCSGETDTDGLCRDCDVREMEADLRRGG